MALTLKPLNQQRIVITGATSGIGLATARMAAHAGAKVTVNGRDEQATGEVADQINREGGRAEAFAGDVADYERMQSLADHAEHTFGGIDTWVNNAGVSIYGRIMDVPLEDQRRLFETNYWGVVNGCCIAAERLRERGGAIINIGSTFSDRAFPLQGPYSATKHAVKAFSDAFRVELEQMGWPICVSLIKPGAIHTLYEDHARDYLPAPPKNPPPTYTPETVARAILHCTAHPTRDLYVGAAAKLIAMTGQWAPRITDHLLRRAAQPMQTAEEPDYAGSRRDNLYEHRPEAAERGGYPHHAQPVSAYTQTTRRPYLALATAAGAGAFMWWLSRHIPTGKPTRHPRAALGRPPLGHTRSPIAR
jgi:NAD(P)-dependent dehydrogenase (short-subunit alcohol dehydrogenase family)